MMLETEKSNKIGNNLYPKTGLKLMIYLIFMSGFIVKDLVVNYTIRSKAF